jgi:hypothetical protein
MYVVSLESKCCHVCSTVFGAETLVPNQTPSFATHIYFYIFIFIFFCFRQTPSFSLESKKKKQRKMMDYTSCETPLTDIKTKEEPTCDKAVNMLLAKLDEVFFF